MTDSHRQSLIRVVAALWLSAAVSAGDEPVWQAEMEDVLRPMARSRVQDVQIVDDAAASGGKAVRLPYGQGGGWAFTSPKLALQGQCRFTFRARAEGLLPISDGVHFTLITHDPRTGAWRHHRRTCVYGVHLKPNGYTPVVLRLDTSVFPDTYRLEVLITPAESALTNAMALVLDEVDVRTDSLAAPVITGVRMDRIRYEPGARAAATVTLVHPGQADVAGVLVGTEHWNLADRRPVFRRRVAVAAGATNELTATWRLSREEYGRERAVELRVDGQVAATGLALYGVSRSPRWLSVSRAAPERAEFWDWAPGDLADLAPEEAVFCSGQGPLFYRSRAAVKAEIAAQTAAGQWPESYVNGTVWGEPGYRLFARRPEWFLYDAQGEVAGYSMEKRERFRRRHHVDFDPRSLEGAVYMFQGVLNHALPEVQDFIAGQLIRTGREMGFRGVRLDVRYFEVHPGERDFRGRPVAETAAEADRISAAAIRRIKARVRRELPHFTFGYNYSAPEEVEAMPLTLAERCRDGGWMLDELPCTYQAKTSPYRVWSAYARRMASWGDRINDLGGIYNPYDFRRSGANYTVDRLYSTVFRLIAGGRSPYCPPFYDERLPFGDVARLAARYSEVFFGRDRDWLPEVAGEVAVTAAAPVWWRDFVLWNRDSRGRRQLVVHLVNPPLAEEVEADPLSRVRPAVVDIEVCAAAVDGRPPSRAWLLMAEPMDWTDEPEVRRLALALRPVESGRAAVRVPSVLFWKVVVFEYE